MLDDHRFQNSCLGQEILPIKNQGYFLAAKHDIIWSVQTIYGEPQSSQEILDFIEDDSQRFYVLPLYAHRFDYDRIVFVVLFHGGLGVISRSFSTINSLGGLDV